MRLIIRFNCFLIDLSLISRVRGRVLGPSFRDFAGHTKSSIVRLFNLFNRVSMSKDNPNTRLEWNKKFQLGYKRSDDDDETIGEVREKKFK